MSQMNLVVGQNGRVVIPAELRRELKLEQGDVLSASVEAGRLVLQTEAALLEQLFEIVGEPPEGELVSETLIRERREAAKSE